jgi:hypothetical protein
MFDIIVAAAPKKVEIESAAAGVGAVEESSARPSPEVAPAALTGVGVGQKRKREEISPRVEAAELSMAPAFKIKKRIMQILEVDGKLKTKRLIKKLSEEALAAGIDTESAAEQIESVLAKLLARGKIVQDSSSKFTMIAYAPDTNDIEA